jgi:hypothetical protein
MSEKLLKILLSELATVRIHCHGPHCHTIMEMPLRELAEKKLDELLCCPHCSHDFDPMQTNKSQLVAFARVAEELLKQKNLVELEFVIPDGEKP